MANRAIIGLLTVLVVMQGLVVYRQRGLTPSLPAKDQPNRVRDAAKGTLVDVSDAPKKGSEIAKVVLIEFSDFECPYCGRHAADTGKKLEREFIESGKVRLAFLNNPLAIHANARLLARAAICAGKQGRYWEMHDLLFVDKPKTKEEVSFLSRKLSLENREFGQCIESDSAVDRQIENDVAKARELQLTGTPAFAIGSIGSDGRVSVQKLVIGALPVDVFRRVINEVIAKTAL